MIEELVKTNVLPAFSTVTRYVLSIFAILLLIMAIYFIHGQYKHVPTHITSSSLIKDEIVVVLLVVTTYLTSWGLGVPITQVLGFDPIQDIGAGVQVLNAVFTGTNLTNLLLVMILLGMSKK